MSAGFGGDTITCLVDSHVVHSNILRGCWPKRTSVNMSMDTKVKKWVKSGRFGSSVAARRKCCWVWGFVVTQLKRSKIFQGFKFILCSGVDTVWSGRWLKTLQRKTGVPSWGLRRRQKAPPKLWQNTECHN